MATLVLERERKINLYDAEIEEAALQVIARRQPVAQDLRAVFAIDKVVTELERAADEAKKLALAVLADSESNGFRPGAATAREARQLGRLAVLMIRASLEAFDRLDPAAAAAVIHQDQEMDSEYAAALRRILTRAMEDVRQTQAAIEAAFIMRSLERIGDHARNIARHVGFIGGQFDPDRDGRAAGVALRQELVGIAVQARVPVPIVRRRGPDPGQWSSSDCRGSGSTHARAPLPRLSSRIESSMSTLKEKDMSRFKTGLEDRSALVAGCSSRCSGRCSRASRRSWMPPEVLREIAGWPPGARRPSQPGPTTIDA